MPRILTLSAVLAASTMALVGCSTGQDAAQSPDPDTQAVDAEQSFDSVDALKEAVTAAGLTCDGGETVEAEGYKESMSCGGNTWLVVFEDDEQQEKKIDQYEEDGSNFLEGENWVVVAPQDTLDKISS